MDNDMFYLSKSWNTGLARTRLWSVLCCKRTIICVTSVLWSSEAFCQSIVPALGTRNISCFGTWCVGAFSRFCWVKTSTRKIITINSYHNCITNLVVIKKQETFNSEFGRLIQCWFNVDWQGWYTVDNCIDFTLKHWCINTDLHINQHYELWNHRCIAIDSHNTSQYQAKL